MHQIPAPGTRTLRYRGDLITFRLSLAEARAGSAWVRTNLGNCQVRREEVIRHVEERLPRLARGWHDVPMRSLGDGQYTLTLPLVDVGHFEAKAFFLPEGRENPDWPPGGNAFFKVEAARSSCANSIYSAFVRQFGPNRRGRLATARVRESIQNLDSSGYTVIPRSGTFRDLKDELDLIIDELGFRILMLLPIHPTPTVYGRMGRFGSPFAALDFMDIDPALAEFDRKTTPLDQFTELVDEIHRRHARVFIDLPVNHTGWASHLHVRHPEWFPRNPDGTFVSPGAWGVTWADLLQLDYGKRAVWRHMAEVFLFWCREGVDGFRCDAGYMVPLPVWEYVTAKVRQAYPDTVFLLEGLGGKLTTTESLLQVGGLDWAYSEIFQNYDRAQLESYLPGAIEWSETVGTAVHFAETHDNNRLAAVSKSYARMRTALAALTSHAGAFGITNGVEWFAAEKIDVHRANSLDWGAKDNQVPWIARLNSLLSAHPAFAGGSSVRMIQQGEGNVLVVRRTPRDEGPEVLVLVNLDAEHSQTACWRQAPEGAPRESRTNLLTGRSVPLQLEGGTVSCKLGAGQVICLADSPGDLLFVSAGAKTFGGEVPTAIRQELLGLALAVHRVHRGTVDFSDLDPAREADALAEAPDAFCAGVVGRPEPAAVTRWSWPGDVRREVMVPPGHFLLIQAEDRFHAGLHDGEQVLCVADSLPLRGGGQFALILPRPDPEDPLLLTLELSVHGPAGTEHALSSLRYLTRGERALVPSSVDCRGASELEYHGLCTNGRGAMAQVRAVWGAIRSQYDCLLAGNLHPRVPVDRHVMLTRIRGWMVHRGYSHELGPDCLDRFSVDRTGVVTWSFSVPAGAGRTVPLEIALRMLPERNAVAIELHRDSTDPEGNTVASADDVTLILRPDIEDRNCHAKTKAFTGPEQAWPQAIEPLADGFVFRPDPERRLVLRAPEAAYVDQPEWIYSVSHPEEADRGLDGSSDLFSPGYLELSLSCGERRVLWAEILVQGEPSAEGELAELTPGEAEPELLPLDRAMDQAIPHFVVRRDESRTVIAGYPWFLDWGRDTLICLRGIIAAGRHEEAADILAQFARFEDRGTLPNTIRGPDTSNRNTSDAPLWFFTACADLLEARGSDELLESDCGGRSLLDVLRSLARFHRDGAANGVRMDPQSGLIFSPSHFTWMDTNYPAGTPREGYPVEIQALWLAAVRLLEKATGEAEWTDLVGLVTESFRSAFTLPDLDHLSDCLHAAPGTPAKEAEADDALRSNQLLAITLGAVPGKADRERILSACQELLVPGAIRSLADRPLSPPLPIRIGDRLLNDPDQPYRGQYRGDEDTERKPAYHNGTAWTWMFPSYCEALFLTYGEPCLESALALLASSAGLAGSGCLGHLPEIVDGDFPHRSRGCSAQAWGATEVYRVWKILTQTRKCT